MTNCHICDKEIDSGIVCGLFCNIVLEATKDSVDMQAIEYAALMGLADEWREEDTGNEYVFQDYLDEFVEKARKTLKSKYSTRKGEAIYKTLINMKAFDMLKDFIHELTLDPETRPYADMLKKEIEYERRRKLERLKFKIETLTGRECEGRYTLQETGDVLGITKERVRQIEQRVMGTHDSKKGHCVGGIFTSPNTARAMRRYIYD